MVFEEVSLLRLRVGDAQRDENIADIHSQPHVVLSGNFDNMVNVFQQLFRSALRTHVSREGRVSIHAHNSAALSQLHYLRIS